MCGNGEDVEDSHVFEVGLDVERSGRAAWNNGNWSGRVEDEEGGKGFPRREQLVWIIELALRVPVTATEYGIDAKKEEGENAIKNSKNSNKDGRHFSKGRGGLIVKFAEVVEFVFFGLR